MVAGFFSVFLLRAITLKKIYDEVIDQLQELKNKSAEFAVFNLENYIELKKIFQIDQIFFRIWEDLGFAVPVKKRFLNVLTKMS